jgi:hypothetical protein
MNQAGKDAIEANEAKIVEISQNIIESCGSKSSISVAYEVHDADGFGANDPAYIVRVHVKSEDRDYQKEMEGIVYRRVRNIMIKAKANGAIWQK